MNETHELMTLNVNFAADLISGVQIEIFINIYN